MAKGSKAPTPDPAVGQAALKQAQLGEDWLEIAKEQFAISNRRNDRLDAIASDVTQQQLDASRQAQQWATEDRDRYKSVFEPLQDEFVQTAANWDSPERQNTRAAEARADVINNAADQDAQRTRQMASMGIDPTSGRYAGVERAADTNTALAAAGAENNAREQTRREGLALQGDAINVGAGLPSQAASSMGLGVSAGSSAVGTTATSNNAYNASLGILQGGYGTAMSGYANQAGLLNQQYGQQLQAYQINQQNKGGGLFGTLGAVAGTAASFLSDEDKKTDKQPARGVLDAVRDMPVEEWTYKDGAGDGGRHIGPYAQDFQRATGKGDGHSIPIVDAIGVTMGAIQELDRKVDQMAGNKPQRGRQGSTGDQGSALAPGQLEPGNIDLHARPIVNNPDGSISTVRSILVGMDGKEYLIPTVAADGSRILSDDEAIQQFQQTGQHLGVFDTPEAATQYANNLHDEQDAEYTPRARQQSNTQGSAPSRRRAAPAGQGAGRSIMREAA